MRKRARSEKTQSTTKERLNKHNWWLLIALPVWTYAAFWMAQLVVLGLVWTLNRVGVPLGSVNEVLLNAIGSVLICASGDLGSESAVLCPSPPNDTEGNGSD